MAKLAITGLGGAVSALLALGMVMMYSAKGDRYLLLQFAWIGLGLVVCVATALVDYRQWKKISVLLLVVSIVLLVLVLIPDFVSFRVKGARRWIGYGGVRFQPSEIAKLALIVALAHYGEVNYRKMHTFTAGLLAPGVIIGAVLGLIFLEPDWGNTLLLASVAGSILLLAGIRWRYLLPPALISLGGLYWLLINNPVRLSRVLAWLDPANHRDGKGYQSWQAMLALASGGVQGLGLADGRQKQGFIPEHHTDFIFSVIGEELGLVACLGIIAAFAVIVICGALIAWHARTRFGFLLGAGLTFLIGLQAFVNIGVVTSVLPNKGLPLPFISYGGSNLIVMMTAVGLLFSIACHAQRIPNEWEDISTDEPAALPY